MPWEFTENHIRPNVFYWSPKAYKERQEVKGRRQEAAGYYKQAKAALADDVNDVEGAEKLLELAVAAWPDNPVYLCALADCVAHKQGDPERALSWYDQLVEAADSPAHRMSRARALAALGWLEEALSDMESALAQEPHNGQYLKERGAAHERLGHTFDATLDFTAALPLLREAGLPQADTIFNRGYCQRLLSNQEEAIKDFEAALQMAPSVTAIKTALGCMYIGKRRYKDALDLFQVVATYRNNSAAAANNLALASYLLATAEDHPGDNKYGRLGKRRAAGSAVSSGTPLKASESTPGLKDPDALSDDDDEASDFDAMLAHQGKANEDPRQWALGVIRGGARKAAGTEPAERTLLESSLRNFNLASNLYMDDQARAKAQARSDGDVHAVHENEPAKMDAVDAMYLLMLTNKVRVPGSPVIHDRELEDGEIQYNRGLVHLILGNLAQAESDFQEALTCNPTHAHYPHYRAVVHGRKGELKDAVKWNQAALSLNPSYFPALYHLGLCLYLQSRNAEAIQRLDAALGLQPKNWMVMEARGRVLQELDRHEEALPALRDALQYCEADEPPSSLARLHFAIAQVCCLVHDLNTAGYDLQSAIATHHPELLRSSLKEARLHGKDPASVYALRGLLAHREAKLKKAMTYMTRAIKLSPQEARFLFDRSQIKLDLQDWTGAVEDMSQALIRLPDAASLHYSRGMALYAIKDNRRALRDLEAAASLVLGEPVPQTPTGNTPNPETHSQSSHLQKAMSIIKGQDNPTSPKPQVALPNLYDVAAAHHQVATAEGRDGSPDPTPGVERLRRWAMQDSATGALSPHPAAAIGAKGKGGVVRTGSKGGAEGPVGLQALLEQKGVLRPDPRLWEGTKFMSNQASPPDLTPSLWYHLGICRAREGGWMQAAAAFERAVQCLPTHPALVHELAKAFQAIGDHRAAIQQFSQVLCLQPGNARALFRRGLSYHALKQYDRAAEDMEAGKRMDPADACLRVDYRSLHACMGEVVGRPGDEAKIWDLPAFPPSLQLPK